MDPCMLRQCESICHVALNGFKRLTGKTSWICACSSNVSRYATLPWTASEGWHGRCHGSVHAPAMRVDMPRCLYIAASRMDLSFVCGHEINEWVVWCIQQCDMPRCLYVAASRMDLSFVCGPEISEWVVCESICHVAYTLLHLEWTWVLCVVLK
jgi:hypothetical protein